MRRIALVALLPVLLFPVACVERRLHIRTDPEGALVRVNGTEVGKSPFAWRFHHYGKVLVEVELPGHEAELRVVELRPPWYQRPVVDFFADVVIPKRIRDDHEVTFPLVPIPTPTEEEIAREVEELAAAALRARAEARAEAHR